MSLVLILVGVGAVAVAASVVRVRRRPPADTVAAAKARARGLYLRLEQRLEHADGPARALATERWHTTGALLAEATTVEECSVAADVAAEGLRLLETPVDG